MPRLTTNPKVGSSVTGGMLCGAILYREGKQLLYAAHSARFTHNDTRKNTYGKPAFRTNSTTSKPKKRNDNRNMHFCSLLFRFLV
jgi:hypothetical protein